MKSGTIVKAYWKRKSETEWREVGSKTSTQKEIK